LSQLFVCVHFSMVCKWNETSLVAQMYRFCTIGIPLVYQLFLGTNFHFFLCMESVYRNCTDLYQSCTIGKMLHTFGIPFPYSSVYRRYTFCTAVYRNMYHRYTNGIPFCTALACKLPIWRTVFVPILYWMVHFWYIKKISFSVLFLYHFVPILYHNHFWCTFLLVGLTEIWTRFLSLTSKLFLTVTLYRCATKTWNVINMSWQDVIHLKTFFLRLWEIL